MEVTKLIDIDGRYYFRPVERYEFGWSDWRSLYPKAAQLPVRPADDRDLIDRSVDIIVDSLVWCADQLLRVVQ